MSIFYPETEFPRGENPRIDEIRSKFNIAMTDGKITNLAVYYQALALQIEMITGKKIWTSDMKAVVLAMVDHEQFDYALTVAVEHIAAQDREAEKSN